MKTMEHKTAFAQIQKQSGLPVKAFAKLLNMSFSYCEKLMYGIRNPSAAVLKAIKEKYPHTDINIFLQ